MLVSGYPDSIASGNMMMTTEKRIKNGQNEVNIPAA